MFSAEVEDTAKSVMEMARAAVAHFGPTDCPVLHTLASAKSDRYAEEICHSVLLGLYLSGLRFVMFGVWCQERRLQNLVAYQSEVSEAWLGAGR